MGSDSKSVSTHTTAGSAQTISGVGGIASGEVFGYAPTVWLTADFAPRWYEDAIREAESCGSDFRRREILFSVASAESYLFEWVRDVVLYRDFRKINQYFPPGTTTPVRKKWKQIPKQLFSDGLIARAPNLCGRTWAEFDRLVDFRNGLLHASSSRPETCGLPPENLPVPSMQDLQGLSQGWAVRVISDLIFELNAAAGTPNPDWLKRT